MRISDWSSDVCSSDLPGQARPDEPLRVAVGELDVAAHAPVRAELPLRAEAAVEVAVVLEQAVTVVAFVAGQRIAFQALRQRGARAGFDAVAIEVQAAAGVELLVGNARAQVGPRTEEHTSELQSLMRSPYAVF